MANSLFLQDSMVVVKVGNKFFSRGFLNMTSWDGACLTAEIRQSAGWKDIHLSVYIGVYSIRILYVLCYCILCILRALFLMKEVKTGISYSNQIAR